MTIDNDPEMQAMSRIVGVLDALDAETRRRVVRWVGERYYKSASANLGQVLEQGRTPVIGGNFDGGTLSPSSETHEVNFTANNLPDFIRQTVGKDKFKNLTVKEQVLLVMKYVESNFDSEAIQSADIMKVIKSFGAINKNSAASYISQLNKRDNFIYEAGNGYALTADGEDKILEIIEGDYSKAEKPKKSKGKSGKKTKKPSRTSGKPARPHAVNLDRGFLAAITKNEPTFPQFLAAYNPDAYEKPVDIIVFAVYYICKVLEKEQANNEEIAACFEAASKSQPDALGQIIRNTANRKRTISYGSAKDITLLYKGEEFVKGAKIGG